MPTASESLEVIFDLGADLIKHSARLFEDGKIDLAIEHAERSQTYIEAALETLTGLASDRSKVDSETHMIRIDPKSGADFEAAVLENNDWRVFARAPLPQLIRAISVAGYSTARIEERFLVPVSNSRYRHYLWLQKQTAA